MMLHDNPDAWIRPLRTEGERLRLFCFPYAGGGPQIFQNWPQGLPSRVGLYAVHLPGRGSRLRSAPFDRLQPIVATLVRALRPMQDLPFAFFGHSLGALLAFETARALRREGSMEPRLLIASACRSPESIEQRERIHNLSDESFIQRLEELGGTPAEVLQNKELLGLLMPTLRADFAVIDTYRYTPAAPLACPITVVSGSADRHASSSTMDGWRLQTSNRVSFHELHGGHFFIHTAKHELRQIVAGDLECLRPRATASKPVVTCSVPRAST